MAVYSFLLKEILFICDEYQWAWAGRLLPSALRLRTSEGKLSLDAEQAHPRFGGGRAGQRALAATALTSAASFALAGCRSSRADT